ncbi:hypothetical protein FOC33_02085 [Plesiomonas shigelloides]|uniref:hypothetical protein n=1 Tax=Plesiomonas shigelloides TaxID=703 RepID=UPI00143E98FD|nr:hypothetical protein [Plesiomonas shigelloides]QIY07827.1 hypothetical protein FOC33_02085 [Plesiomonas shigelloides]
MLLNKNVKELLMAFFTFIKSRITLHSFYIIASLVLGYHLVDNISLADVKPIMGTLQNIAAAVFTLAGIWIAYSYPQAIAAYTSPNSVKVIPTDETKRIENLVLIVLTSAFVISSLLLINIFYLLIYKSISDLDNLHILKMLGISSVFYLAFLQLKAIFIVMITNVAFVNELHHKKTEKDANDDL